MCEDEDKMSERWSSNARNTSRKRGRWILIGESIMGGTWNRWLDGKRALRFLGQEVWMVNPSPVCLAADDSRVSSVAHARPNHADADVLVETARKQEGK
ncbi:hypothetical protein HZH68_005513 [Vespula germanica]|uniref:Uncharacterized protein n=1 Tax=Vespula germanica TaxID=30212 RepID=A0A834NFJ3_VESGE|nr:hypothetical protein HZH68_005513 [Vespula germanica]